MNFPNWRGNKTAQGSGIVNALNGWFAAPRDLVTAIKRIVYVSVESTLIIDQLPAEITAEQDFSLGSNTE